MFHAAGLMLLNKIDLPPCVSFVVDRRTEYARRVNRRTGVLEAPAASGEGMDGW
jgi:hydrogenase nickel incorporation protein HypB